MGFWRSKVQILSPRYFSKGLPCDSDSPFALIFNNLQYFTNFDYLFSFPQLSARLPNFSWNHVPGYVPSSQLRSSCKKDAPRGVLLLSSEISATYSKWKTGHFIQEMSRFFDIAKIPWPVFQLTVDGILAGFSVGLCTWSVPFAVINALDQVRWLHILGMITALSFANEPKKSQLQFAKP